MLIEEVRVDPFVVILIRKTFIEEALINGNQSKELLAIVTFLFFIVVFKRLGSFTASDLG